MTRRHWLLTASIVGLYGLLAAPHVPRPQPAEAAAGGGLIFTITAPSPTSSPTPTTHGKGHRK